MDSSLVAGLFGLVGALIGGCGTLAVNVLNLRSQQLGAQIERRNTLIDRQFQAHLGFLGRGATFQDRARDYVSCRTRSVSSRDKDRAKQLCDDAWNLYSDQASAAQLSGPLHLGESVVALNRQYKIYQKYLTELHSANESDWPERVKRCRNQSHRVFRARVDYLAQAQRYFDASTGA